MQACVFTVTFDVIDAIHNWSTLQRQVYHRLDFLTFKHTHRRPLPPHRSSAVSDPSVFVLVKAYA
jgi:hypothetical protein